jgi:hypothetical protein
MTSMEFCVTICACRKVGATLLGYDNIARDIAVV